MVTDTERPPSFFKISESAPVIHRYQTEVKIPNLLPSILDQSTTPTRPMQIYIDVGVSLLHFKYPAALNKT